MSEKAAIVAHLAEPALLLPSLLNAALAANDRAKTRMSLLQTAAAHATKPLSPVPSLEAERRATGINEPDFDATVAGAHDLGGGRLGIPGVQALLTALGDDLRTIMAPLRAARAAAEPALGKRLAAVLAGFPHAEHDQIEMRQIADLTSARDGGPDSLHLVLMDLHKAINTLASETAVETIDGARVYRLAPEDRTRVRAFMRGLNRTAPLKFGHPGLATTATRIGPRLSIQNDIGTTDAHVLVVHVEAGRVHLIHTDVHRARAKFFVSLFAGRKVEWQPFSEDRAEGLGGDGTFYLVSGTFTSTDVADLDAFLEFLGSRIVFLIDWNRARKTLRGFVGGRRAAEILSFAAAHDYGHRAFLELGGAELVFEAVRKTAGERIPYGARLDETLGASATVAFLRQVLQHASQGLSTGRSARLIRDEIQADLAETFETAEAQVLTIVLRNLGLSRMLAARIWDALSGDRLPPASERQALVRRAKAIEEKADRLTVLARDSEARIRQPRETFRPLIEGVENTADCLDECAFLLSIWPGLQPDAPILAPLAALAAIATESVGHLVRAVAATASLGNGRHVDAEDALRGIDAVLCEEHNADAASRRALASFMAAPCSDPRVPMLGAEIARMLETSTDHLAHAALSLRDRVIEELAG